MESPSKRKLRMSVSCDNYLGDGKFSLCRRDSVGSGSPHSSKVNHIVQSAIIVDINMLKYKKKSIYLYTYEISQIFLIC